MNITCTWRPRHEDAIPLRGTGSMEQGICVLGLYIESQQA